MKNTAKAKDNGRKWMWGFLAVVILLQLYFVKELLAAFALFAMGFAAIGFVVASIYMLHKGWAVAVERVADSGHPWVAATKRSLSAVEELARRVPSGAQILSRRGKGAVALN